MALKNFKIPFLGGSLLNFFIIFLRKSFFSLPNTQILGNKVGNSQNKTLKATFYELIEVEDQNPQKRYKLKKIQCINILSRFWIKMIKLKGVKGKNFPCSI